MISGWDLVATAEHQPRQGEPNRLRQIRDQLSNQSPFTSEAEDSDTIDPSTDQLLLERGQPRLVS